MSFGEAAKKYKTVAGYDSAQQLLPSGKKDNWLKQRLNRKAISLQEKYGNNQSQLLKDLLNKFIHGFPYLLFVSLPLYALFLKLIYIRRKKFYYVDHGVFLIHLYIFTFLLLLLFFGFDKLGSITGWEVWKFLKLILVVSGIYYSYRAMKNFYGQSTLKTLFKFILFTIVCLIFLLILFSAFFIFSFYRI